MLFFGTIYFLPVKIFCLIRCQFQPGVASKVLLIIKKPHILVLGGKNIHVAIDSKYQNYSFQ